MHTLLELAEQSGGASFGPGSRADASSPQAVSTEGFDPSRGRFYIDCEFDGHGGPLLSMALVHDSGRSIYLCVADKPAVLDPWVSANVWPLVHIRLPVGRTVAYLNDWGHFIRRFIGAVENPVIVADSPVDIGRFCAVISTGADGGWASAEYPRMTFEVHNVDCYPTSLPGAVQHNAWWDAMALRHVLASAIEARQGGDANAAPSSDESAVAKPDAQEVSA